MCDIIFHMKKIITSAAIVLFIVCSITINPSVSLASWWNPISWFNNWSFTNNTEITTEVVPDQKVLGTDQNKAQNNLVPTKISPPQSSTKPVNQVSPSKFQVKDNINSAIVDENTDVVLNLSFNGKVESDMVVSFKLVRDSDNRVYSIEPGINLEYLLNNAGVYKPDLKKLIGPISQGQANTTTYHILVDVIKDVATTIDPKTVLIKKAVQFSANSRKFKIVTKPTIQSNISIVSPNSGSVLQVGQSHDITWTGSASMVSSYGVYLNNSSLGFENRTYLGSVNSMENKFTLKIPSNIDPSLYRIQLLSGDQVVAYSSLFTITNNSQYNIGSSDQYIDVNTMAMAKIRDARGRAEVYYSAKNTYLGFCASDPEIQIKDNRLNCLDSSTAYSITVPIANGNFQCVDSVGYNSNKTSINVKTACE